MSIDDQVSMEVEGHGHMSNSSSPLCRCEIDATLERLRRLERDLGTKEKELEEREQRLKLWEERLMERSNVTPVSSLHVWPGFKDHNASFMYVFYLFYNLI